MGVWEMKLITRLKPLCSTRRGLVDEEIRASGGITSVSLFQVLLDSIARRYSMRSEKTTASWFRGQFLLRRFAALLGYRCFLQLPLPSKWLLILQGFGYTSNQERRESSFR